MHLPPTLHTRISHQCFCTQSTFLQNKTNRPWRFVGTLFNFFLSINYSVPLLSPLFESSPCVAEYGPLPKARQVWSQHKPLAIPAQGGESGGKPRREKPPSISHHPPFNEHKRQVQQFLAAGFTALVTRSVNQSVRWSERLSVAMSARGGLHHLKILPWLNCLPPKSPSHMKYVLMVFLAAGSSGFSLVHL